MREHQPEVWVSDLVIARPPQRKAGKSLKWRDERITPTREIKQQRNT